MISIPTDPSLHRVFDVAAWAAALAAVEHYKRAKGMRGSTGGAFVAPFAIGVAVRRR